MLSGGGCLVVWFEFLVTNTFLIWNVRWAIKLEDAQLKAVRHWSTKWPPWNFCVERENSMYQRSVLELGYNQPTSKQAQVVCKFVWMKNVASSFSQGWGQKWGSLPLLSLATDALMVRKCCWLLEGKTTQSIEQQAENKSDNCILGINYSFVGHTFVTRNSNQTTRCSPLGERGRLGTRLWFLCCCTQLHVVYS